MVRTMRLRWVVVGTAPGHPLAPFVVGHKRQGKDDEGENGEGKLHKTGQGIRESGSKDPKPDSDSVGVLHGGG